MFIFINYLAIKNSKLRRLMTFYIREMLYGRTFELISSLELVPLFDTVLCLQNCGRVLCKLHIGVQTANSEPCVFSGDQATPASPGSSTLCRGGR